MESRESGHSVSGWWEQLKLGHTGAADELWQRFFERMVRTARRSLPSGATQKRGGGEVSRLSSTSPLLINEHYPAAIPNGALRAIAC